MHAKNEVFSASPYVTGGYRTGYVIRFYKATLQWA